jgi:succinyl-CoA synthetase beta subunit
MRLLEFQAKEILRDYGVPVPDGRVLADAGDLDGIAYPAVFKAQVPVGGRGKAGAIRRLETAETAAETAAELLAAVVKGHPVSTLLVEAAEAVEAELYLALLTDKQRNRPLLMSSPSGGVDIEAVARTTPEQIKKQYLDPAVGIQPFHLRGLAKFLGITDQKSLAAIVRRLWRIFQAEDATLVELNPLALTARGLTALDAKIVLDDKAAFRHPDRFARLTAEQTQLDKRPRSRAEAMAEEHQINYVALDGDIGMIADGAGTGMLTMDMITDAGGRPANFCEMGGLANTDIMQRTMGIVLDDDRLKALMISLIGGLTRMDEMAAGIVAHLRQSPCPVPVVVRMCGTMAEAGVPMLQKAGVDTTEDLATAVRTAVERSRQ